MSSTPLDTGDSDHVGHVQQDVAERLGGSHGLNENLDERGCSLGVLPSSSRTPPRIVYIISALPFSFKTIRLHILSTTITKHSLTSNFSLHIFLPFHTTPIMKWYLPLAVMAAPAFAAPAQEKRGVASYSNGPSGKPLIARPSKHLLC